MMNYLRRMMAAALLLLGGSWLYATDITTNDGTFYRKAEIVKTTPLGFHFICDGKAGWLDYRDLPAAEALALGYDPVKAKAFEEKLAANQGCALPDNAMPPTDDPQLAAMMQNPDNAEPTAANTTIINPGDPVTYDPAILTGNVVLDAPVTQWVSWGGHYYPAYYWHHWYWSHHWYCWHGRYYPAHYYYHHGCWYHGHYYPYHHGVLYHHPEYHPEYHACSHCGHFHGGHR